MSRFTAVVRSVLPFLAALPLLAGVQIGLDAGRHDYASVVLVRVAIAVILAVSLNVVNGFTGQFSLGHAGFMSIGAYTASKITLAFADMKISGLPDTVSDQVVFAVALAAGMATATVAGLLVGLPSLRLRGDYLAIVTLGFGEIIRSLVENIRWLGGALGLHDVPLRTSVVWAGLGALATVVMARRLAASTQGRALFAIREDEVAAEAMGVDALGYKVRAFVIAAAYAGLAGGLYAHHVGAITPSDFNFARSIEIVVMVVLGGLGSVTGSILAAAGLTLGLEALREFQRYRMVVYAIVLIVLMLVRPQGIFGTREIWDLPLVRRLFRRRGPRGPGGASPTQVRDERGAPAG